MVNINDASSYKKCRKKLYDIHVCMPPKGTIVINKLEQLDVACMFKKTYFTVAELEKMKVETPSIYNSLINCVQQGKAYIVSEGTPFVLAGTVGELWTIKPSKLQSGYVFVTGQGTIQINQESLNSRLKNGCLPWTVVRTVPDASVAWACFAPENMRFTIQTAWGSVLNCNAVGVEHGKGDFVIAADADGKPNLADRWVVNGEVFARTYDNHGWTKYLDTRPVESIVVNSLPDLCIKSNTIPAFVFKGFDFIAKSSAGILSHKINTLDNLAVLNVKFFNYNQYVTYNASSNLLSIYVTPNNVGLNPESVPHFTQNVFNEQGIISAYNSFFYHMCMKKDSGFTVLLKLASFPYTSSFNSTAPDKLLGSEVMSIYISYVEHKGIQSGYMKLYHLCNVISSFTKHLVSDVGGEPISIFIGGLLESNEVVINYTAYGVSGRLCLWLADNTMMVCLNHTAEWNFEYSLSFEDDSVGDVMSDCVKTIKKLSDQGTATQYGELPSICSKYKLDFNYLRENVIDKYISLVDEATNDKSLASGLVSDADIAISGVIAILGEAKCYLESKVPGIVVDILDGDYELESLTECSYYFTLELLTVWAGERMICCCDVVLSTDSTKPYLGWHTHSDCVELDSNESFDYTNPLRGNDYKEGIRLGDWIKGLLLDALGDLSLFDGTMGKACTREFNNLLKYISKYTDASSYDKVESAIKAVLTDKDSIAKHGYSSNAGSYYVCRAVVNLIHSLEKYANDSGFSLKLSFDRIEGNLEDDCTLPISYEFTSGEFEGLWGYVSSFDLRYQGWYFCTWFENDDDNYERSIYVESLSIRTIGEYFKDAYLAFIVK